MKDDITTISSKNSKVNLFLKWILLSFVYIGLLIVIALGIYGVSKQDFQKTSAFENTYSIQVDVNKEASDSVTIEQISKHVEDSLKFNNYVNSYVYIVGNDSIKIETTLNSLNQDDVFSTSNEKIFFQSVAQLYFSVFSKYNVEFRTPNGDQLFQMINGQIEFVPPPTEPTEPTEPTTTSNSTTNESSSKKPLDDVVEPYEIQLISNNSAKIEYRNGYPIIKFIPSGNLWVQFEAATKWLYENASSETTNGNMYVVWFGYSTLEYIVTTLDASNYEAAGNNLLTYCYVDPVTATQIETPKDICRPFLAGYGAPTGYLNPWDPYVSLALSFENGISTNEHVSSIVNKLNFSTQSFYFENPTTIFYFNEKSSSDSLMIIAIVLGIIIVVAMFTMAWYYGLLGIIGAIFLGLMATLGLAFIPLFGIPITGLAIFGFVIIILLFSFLVMSALKTIKANLKKNLTLRNTYSLSLKEVFAHNFPLHFTLVIVLFISAIFFPTSAQIVLLYIALMILLGYLILAFLPLTASILTFNFLKINSSKRFQRANNLVKWDIYLGVIEKKQKYKNLSNVFSTYFSKTSSTKFVKILSSITLLFAIGSLTTFGVLYGVNGEGMNYSGQYVSQYQYDVVKTKFIDTSNGGQGEYDPEDPYRQKEEVNKVKNDKAIIQDVMDDFISIEGARIIRYDDFQFTTVIPPDTPETPTVEFKYLFSYGFEFYSSTMLSVEQIATINTKLQTLSSSYTLMLSGSLYNVSTNAAIATNTISKAYTYPILYGLIIAMLVTTIILTIIYRWAYGLSTMISIGVELLMSFSLVTLFFAPTTPIFIFSLFSLFIISLITKFIILRSVKRSMSLLNEKESYDQKKIIQVVNEGTKKSFFRSLILITLMIMVGSILLSSFGYVYITFIVLMLFGGLLILLFNVSLYPWLLSRFEYNRRISKERMINADKNKVNEKTVVEEEYIKGVNY